MSEIDSIRQRLGVTYGSIIIYYNLYYNLYYRSKLRTKMRTKSSKLSADFLLQKNTGNS